jgi:MoaA/NifB/PqqE/SkfB family radical SAM enzyme
MHPFTGLATREDGAVKVCCRSQPIGWIQEDSLEDIWNGENMQEVRRQVLNDEIPEVCRPCFDLENQGVESLRQRHINGIIPEARINLYPKAIDALRKDYTMPFEFPTIEIKLNNLCNLRCRMCNPLDSTNWNDWDKVVEFYKKENNYLVPTVEKLVSKPGQYIGPFDDTANWWNDFEKLLPHFRRVEFAGGEPLMDPQHYKILDMLAPYGDQIEIKYATNLTMLGKGNRSIWEYWPKFKSVAVNVSIDGVGDVYEYIRSNASWAGLVKNIRQIQTIPNISRIVGAVTVQVSNVLTLDKICETFLDKLGIIFHTHRVSYPRLLSAQVLPHPLKNLAILRLEELKKRVPNFKLVIERPELLEYTIRQIDDNINYIKAIDQSELWDDCVEFNHRLDHSRDSKSFAGVNIEFTDYV